MQPLTGDVKMYRLWPLPKISCSIIVWILLDYDQYKTYPLTEDTVLDVLKKFVLQKCVESILDPYLVLGRS